MTTISLKALTHVKSDHSRIRGIVTRTATALQNRGGVESSVLVPEGLGIVEEERQSE